MGQLYRLKTATTADKSSVGAVTEALAGTCYRARTVFRRTAHARSKICRDQDRENGFLKDGQITPEKRDSVESLGKYKAFFLVTADRDGVGSRGQNKFFAIDPGHSLEGNGRFLEVNDNFSFKPQSPASRIFPSLTTTRALRNFRGPWISAPCSNLERLSRRLFHQGTGDFPRRDRAASEDPQRT